MTPAEQRFWDVYAEPSEEEDFDELSAAEYARVLREWLKSGEPDPAQFVRQAASGELQEPGAA